MATLNADFAVDDVVLFRGVVYRIYLVIPEKVVLERYKAHGMLVELTQQDAVDEIIKKPSPEYVHQYIWLFDMCESFLMLLLNGVRSTMSQEEALDYASKELLSLWDTVIPSFNLAATLETTEMAAFIVARLVEYVSSALSKDNTEEAKVAQ